MMKWVLVAGVGLAGCGAPEDAVEPEDETSVDDGKYEAFNRENNPAFLDPTFVYEADKLPVEGQTKEPPTPGDYWATASDSINVRWDGDSDSPAEKFGKAFNKPEFAKAVTDNWGIYGHGRKACNEGSECEDQKDGSSCVKPRGATGDKAGRCIPGWWGICHGWAPFALSEKAPVKPVVKNGVTFYPGDLEALGSLVYSENLPTKFLSARCNKKPEDIIKDPTGRIADADMACRDTNPGAFHVVAANFLGMRKTGVVEDRTFSDQVWNQPVSGFKVTNAENGKLKEISKAEAIGMLGLGLKYDPLLAETVVKKMEKKTGSFTAPADGVFIIKMSGTGDGDLHVKKGAEATEAVYDCRPYAGTSDEECKFTDVKKGDKLFYMINGYGDESKVTISVGSNSGANEYVYNTSAKRFFYVEMDFSYISESRPARESHVSEVANYTRSDHYEYILETDANARIQGGEWVGDSRTAHPDFIWYPSAKPRGQLAGGLTYEAVKGLLDQAAADGGMPTEETKTLFEGPVKSVSTYVTVGVPAGGKLKLVVSGGEKVELYVKVGRKPTITVFDKKVVGTQADKTLELTAGPSGGTYYVRLRPTGASLNVKLVSTITK